MVLRPRSGLPGHPRGVTLGVGSGAPEVAYPRVLRLPQRPGLRRRRAGVRVREPDRGVARPAEARRPRRGSRPTSAARRRSATPGSSSTSATTRSRWSTSIFAVEIAFLFPWALVLREAFADTGAAAGTGIGALRPGRGRALHRDPLPRAWPTCGPRATSTGCSPTPGRRYQPQASRRAPCALRAVARSRPSARLPRPRPRRPPSRPARPPPSRSRLSARESRAPWVCSRTQFEENVLTTKVDWLLNWAGCRASGR